MRRILLFLAAFLLLIMPCFADEINMRELEDSLPNSAKDTVGSIEDVGDTDSFIGRLIENLKESVAERSSALIKRASAILIISVICSVIGIFGNESIPDFVPMCGCFAATLVIVGSLDSYLTMGAETIGDISLFSKVLLPALCTAGAACGSFTASAVRYAASALFIDVFISIAQNVILPLICAYLAVQTAACTFDQKLLKTVASVLKWLCTSIMVLLCLTFTVYLGVSSAVAQSGDAVAVKLTKTAISSAIPVVGSIISDAASSVAAGAELIKTTIGAFGLVSVIAICAGPIFITGLNFIVYKAAAQCAKAFDVPRLSELSSGFATAFGMILALIGTCSVMLFIAIISCMRAVVG